MELLVISKTATPGTNMLVTGGKGYSFTGIDESLDRFTHFVEANFILNICSVIVSQHKIHNTTLMGKLLKVKGDHEG